MPRKTYHDTKAQKSKPAKPTRLWPLYLLLVLLVIGYSLQNNILLGAGAFVVVIIIVVVIARDVKHEVAVKGSGEGVKEIVLAIAAALVIWGILIFVLQTSSPINAVASCSMLPNLQKGDVIILHGISNFSQFVKSNHIPSIALSTQDFQNFESNISGEFLAYEAYFGANQSKISIYLPPINNLTYSVALYNTQCITRYQYLNQPQNLRLCYVGQNPSSNLIKYNYTIGQLSTAGLTYRIIQTSQITVKNTTLLENFSNPIIVYSTIPQDTFPGSIIHRLVAVLNVNGTYYTLTRGDNNPALDLQFGNYPAAQSAVIGSVLANFPLIGYFKLIISGQIGATPGCNQVITKH